VTLHGTGAHAFDTGLLNSQRSTIRAALVTRLGALLKSNGRYMRSVQPLPRAYRGEGDEEGESILSTAFQGQAPALGVALGRKTYEAADIEAHIARGEITVTIYAVSQNVRAEVEGRLEMDKIGGASIDADPGIEAMLEHVEELLLGQSIPVAGTTELRPVSEDEVQTFEDVTIWEQVYTLNVERQINPHRAATVVATEIEGHHTPHDIEETAPENLNPLVTTLAELEEPDEEEAP
jgi:hypothetical protein